MNKLIQISVLIFIWTGLLLLPSCAEVPQRTSSFSLREMNKTLFPARVKFVLFNNILDKTNSVCWGRWCMSFGAEPPIARWLSGGEDRMIAIEYFSCNNAAVGYRKCSLLYHEYYVDGLLNQVCVVSFDYPDFFKIQCPVDIGFE